MLHIWTRRFGALLLVLSLGLSIPAVAGPLHICLSGFLQAEEPKEDCCGQHSDDSESQKPEDCSCCLDLQELPEAPVPPSPEPTPGASVTDLGWTPSVPPLADIHSIEVAAERPDRIRGPTKPSDHRALLEIWRL